MVSVEIVDWEPFSPASPKRKLVLDIGPLSIPDDYWKEHKATAFPHGPRGKNYTAVRIVISKLQNFIGRNYVTFRGKATYKHTEDQELIEQKQGDCIILFFPEKKDEKEE